MRACAHVWKRGGYTRSHLWRMLARIQYPNLPPWSAPYARVAVSEPCAHAERAETVTRSIDNPAIATYCTSDRRAVVGCCVESDSRLRVYEATAPVPEPCRNE